MNRFLVGLALALPSIGALLAEPVAPAADYLQPFPRSVDADVFDIWRSPERFTKNPDIIDLPDGRLMLVYADNDRHWSQEEQFLTLLTSADQGRTWKKFGVVDHHDMRKGEERLVTPRLSRLQDGRLVVIVDEDDFGFFHQNQRPGMLCYWSSDGGAHWTPAQSIEAVGFEPDRILDLPDGTLGFAAQYMRAATQELCEVLVTSADGGRSWRERSIIASDGYHRFCEGAIVVLDGGRELACVMRENHSAGMPDYAAFSRDNGQTWSAPQTLPFSFHRPYAKALADGRVFVTGRNVLGPLGTFGWAGDLRRAAGRYEIGGPAARYTASFDGGALRLDNRPREAARYTLFPPESSRSEIHFSARLKVAGPPGVPVAFLSLARVNASRGAVVLGIAANELRLLPAGDSHYASMAGNPIFDKAGDDIDSRRAVDLTGYHTVALDLRQGLLHVLVDGKVVINSCVFWESLPLNDFVSQDPSKRSQFGALGSEGRSWWQEVAYQVDNPSQPPVRWRWSAAEGKWPDQYQRENLLQIYGNPYLPGHSPDHGYSSWLTLKDGRILLVDYTNRGDPAGKSHLVGVYLQPATLQPPARAGLTGTP